jgi:hypothetical protein
LDTGLDKLLQKDLEIASIIHAWPDLPESVKLRMKTFVENLVVLLDSKDDRLKRLACKDVIEYILEHKAVEDLESRIEAIEQRLSDKRI